MNPDDAPHDDEGHGREEHQAHVRIGAAVCDVPTLGNNAEPQQRTRSQQLAEEGDRHQNHTVAQTVADTVEERRPGLVAQRESLDAAHDDTVGDNQADVDRQLFGFFVDIRFEYLIDEGDYRIVEAAEYGAGEGWLMHADLAEKGYADIVLRTKSEGGHSSNPYGGTSLEVLSRAIAAICDIEWPARVTDLLAAQLVELGLYTADEIAASKDAIVRDCLASKKLYPLVTTTCAPTQIEGGSTGANVMPQDMWANINFRMLEGTSVADVVARCREAVAGADLAGRVEVELGPGSSEPSPSPRIGGPGLEAVRSIAARYFRDPKGTEENGSSAVGQEPMSIVPSTVIGATDAANYQRICHECIRFSAFVVDDDECDRGVHGTNERITRRVYLQGARFFIALLHTL